MMLKLNISFSILLVCLCCNGWSQSANYRHRAKIVGVSKNWHRLRLPISLFDKAKLDLTDLRIYGFTASDTIEAPFILEKSADQVIEKEIGFETINQSHDKQSYYFTFQLNELKTINQIRLHFQQENFDWKASLDGSNDNTDWFRILTNQRILSIKNTKADYRFSQLDFPMSKYRYFRIQIKADIPPQLNAAKILRTDTVKGTSQSISYQSFKTYNDVKTKKTFVDIVLNAPTPLAELKLDILNTADFYRPFKIEYAVDSVQTDKETQYHYARLYSGTLSTLRAPSFSFGGNLVKRMRIIIENDDNEPLVIKNVALKASVYDLVARFKNPNYQYWLYFGNTDALAPVYDLENFENKIPINISTLELEATQTNPSYLEKKDDAIFKSKYWIWAIMGLIISILGFFTIKMLKEPL